MSADSKVLGMGTLDRMGRLVGVTLLADGHKSAAHEYFDKTCPDMAPHKLVELVAHNPEREAVIKELIRVVETDVAMRQSSAGYAAWQLWNSCTAVADALARYKETTS